MDLDHQDHLAEVKTAINELGKPSNHSYPVRQLHCCGIGWR